MEFVSLIFSLFWLNQITSIKFNKKYYLINIYVINSTGSSGNVYSLLLYLTSLPGIVVMGGPQDAKEY